MKTVIIAEAGVNHNGDLQMARELINVAADSGVDYVKFQTFDPKSLVTKSALKAVYQEKATGGDTTQLAMLEKLKLTEEMHTELVAHCNMRGVKFLSTAFDSASLKLLLNLGLDYLKIPSGEITNKPFLREIAHASLPVIMSTGMASLQEVEDALFVLEDSGVSKKDIFILHCNTEYPTPFEDVNLRAMLAMGKALGIRTGYSDHTVGIEVPVAAVAMGAQVIEKHYTLDRSLPGPDHRASLEPDELKSMVKAIRNIEMALGAEIKEPSPSEQKNISVARRSVVAASRIEEGDLFTERNLTCKRPGTGISPMLWDELIGQVADRSYECDQLIEWSCDR